MGNFQVESKHKSIGNCNKLVKTNTDKPGDRLSSGVIRMPQIGYCEN